MPCVDEPLQDSDQLLGIRHVQADRRLIEHVQRGACTARAASTRILPLGPHFRELRDELDTLRLTARERRALLPERQVSEPDTLQQAQRMMNARMGAEEIGSFIDAHHQHIADRLALVLDRQSVLVEPSTPTRVANDSHIRKKAHFDSAQSLALARLAASARGIEREARSCIASHTRLARFREYASNRIPESDVRCRT